MRPGPEEVLTGSSTPLGRRCPPPQNLPSLDTSWIEGAKTLDELHQALKSCRNCNLSESRSAVIPGRGPAGAPVFFVFDTPDSGALESRRIPNGPEAELFDNIVTKGLKLKPEDVYVTAISKCPLPDPSAFDGTYPMKACSHTLFREIELVRPKAVVALGARPAQILSGLDKKSFLFLKRMNMVIGRAKDIPFKVTFDLPTIMDDIDIKKEFWRDLKEVMKRL
jgi:uracil-DNA glycosylase family 4